MVGVTFKEYVDGIKSCFGILEDFSIGGLVVVLSENAFNQYSSIFGKIDSIKDQRKGWKEVAITGYSIPITKITLYVEDEKWYGQEPFKVNGMNHIVLPVSTEVEEDKKPKVKERKLALVR